MVKLLYQGVDCVDIAEEFLPNMLIYYCYFDSGWWSVRDIFLFKTKADIVVHTVIDGPVRK